MDGLTQAEINEYWETVEAIVASRSIQWMGQGPAEAAEEPLEDPVEPPKRTRDTSLATQSSKRSRDRFLPQRKGTL